MPLTLSSPAFSPHSDIPRKYTCEGENISPPLTWSGVPDNAKSLVLVVEDPDAPSGMFRHWAAFDIPPGQSGLDEGYGAGSSANGFHEAVNDFGKPGYGGPCPPPGHGTHHYHFRLLALREARLALPTSPRCAQVLEAAKPLVIEKAELVGTYARGGR